MESAQPGSDPAEIVRRFLRLYPPGRRLCVAYSGGIDSSVLLDLMAGLRGEFDFALSAVHVHHGLSPDADAWAVHCRQRCAQLNIPIQVSRVTVERTGHGLEAAARTARYRAYAELEVDTLALAQQRDDQAETLLLQLLRGAGMKGLASMPQARTHGHLTLLRPLLAVPRGDIEEYARIHALSWVEDASNRDTGLRRNALRQILLPELAQRFPGAAMVLARAATQFSETAALLDDLARLDGAAAASIEVAHLARLDAGRARNLLRHYLELHGVPIGRERLHEALEQMLGARADAEPVVDFGVASLRRYQGRVRLVSKAPAAQARIWHWQGETEVELGGAGSLLFSADKGGVRLSGEVTIRLRSGGERLRPHLGGPERTLKNLLREAGVPPWLRARLPLVYVADTLVWAAEVGADATHLARAEEAGWIISWRPRG